MNKIWKYLIIIGLITSFILNKEEEVLKSIINSGIESWNLFLKLSLLMLFLNGVFEIAKDAQLTKILTKILKKPLSLLFPKIDQNSLCMEYIATNVVANMLGLGACATSIGLKTMELLKEENQNKEIINRNMIKFVLINISTLSFIPTSILTIRISLNSHFDIIYMSILVSCFSFIITLVIEMIFNFIKRGQQC